MRKNSKSRPRVLLDLFLFPGFACFHLSCDEISFTAQGSSTHESWYKLLCFLKALAYFMALMRRWISKTRGNIPAYLLIKKVFTDRQGHRIYIDLLKEDAQGGICINLAHHCYLPRLIDPAPFCMVADLSSFYSLDRGSTSLKISPLGDPNPKLFGFRRLLLR